MTPATCHSDRPHHARGLCKVCYNKLRHQERRQGLHRKAECVVCHDLFSATRIDAAYCTEECRRVGYTWAQAERRGCRPEAEEVIATRDRGVALDLAQTAKSRGCARIHPNASGERYGLTAYYSAWYRGEGLYIIRVRWPDGERIAA